MAPFSTFKLDSDAALRLFIETLLRNTNGQSQGDAALESTKHQHSKLLAKATEMVPLLRSTKDLAIGLSEILYKVSETVVASACPLSSSLTDWIHILTDCICKS